MYLRSPSFPNENGAESILRDAHLHQVSPPQSRLEQLRADDELLGVDDVFSSANSSNGNRSPIVPLTMAADDAPLAAAAHDVVTSGLTAAVDAVASPRSHSRDYPNAGSRPFSRHYDPCDHHGVDPRQVDGDPDYSVPFSRRFSAALILVLSVVAWWAFHTVTPEPLSWTEWFFRKIGVRYWTP